MTDLLVLDVLVILTAGLLAGLICRRLGISVLVGYLVVGALIGYESLGLISAARHHDIEHLAEAGVLLLLFSIGLEFSLEDLARMSRHLVVGGLTQMLLVGVPAGLFMYWFLDARWEAAVLLGMAVSLSSTVLVFKALAEWGQTTTPHGRRAIGILLCQDVALVPMLLVIPLLTGDGAEVGSGGVLKLALLSAGLVAGVLIGRQIMVRWIVPELASLRSTELLVLFVIVALGGVTMLVYLAGLPASLGAFAAGLMFSDNRLTGQVDAVVLPLRETFAAVFFVSLGMLLDPDLLIREPLVIFGELGAILLLKTAAATVALRLTGLRWPVALAVGMGLAQVGEFAFVLSLEGLKAELITPANYQRLLAFSLGTLILTPQLLRFGIGRLTGQVLSEQAAAPEASAGPDDGVQRAIVVGAGPIGRQVASRLEISGVEVCMLDLSPVNLHPFAQQGFLTVAGDATDAEVLQRARLATSNLVAVCLPDDQIALAVVRAVREVTKKCRVLARCRYQENTTGLRNAGADAVVCEEVQASEAIVRALSTIRQKRT